MTDAPVLVQVERSGTVESQHRGHVVVVMVDEPREGRFASTVACPVFRRIGEGLMALGRMRERQEENADVVALLDPEDMPTEHEDIVQ